jgi:hypothetical protein
LRYAFFEHIKKDGKKVISFNYNGAKQAFAWFAKNNVKVVSMAFYQQDSENMRELVSAAKENNIQIIAGTPNEIGKKQDTRVYPAAYSGVISIAGIKPGRYAPVQQSKDLAYWVSFVSDSRSPKNVEIDNGIDYGSSIATGRITAFIAYYLSKSSNQAFDILREISVRDVMKETNSEVRYVDVNKF